MGGRIGAWTLSALLLLTLSAGLFSTSADQAGDIAFSTDGIAISPSALTEGDTATIEVSLQNMANEIATDVSVEFHRDAYNAGSPASLQTLSIDANDFATVDWSWTGLDYGTRDVFIRVSHDGEAAIISKSFSVAGLANLRVGDLSLSPDAGVEEGDLMQMAILVENSGNADAPASHISIDFAGTVNLVEVPAIDKGDSEWVNQSATAPAPGEHTLRVEVNADSADGIVETTSADNADSLGFTVVTQPDYLHLAGPDVVPTAHALSGPWTISGEVARQGGHGDTSVDLGLATSAGLHIATIPLSFSEDDAIAAWEVQVTAAMLNDPAPGQVIVDVRIDPNDAVSQANTFNDDAQVGLTVYPPPNVVVFDQATPSREQVTTGESVQFSVTVQNVGQITTHGTLTASFDGEVFDTRTITLTPQGEGTFATEVVQFDVLIQSQTNGPKVFTAVWEAGDGAHDSASDDNTATGEVTLVSNLQLEILGTTEAWQPGLPLYAGGSYVYQIEIVSRSGSGEEVFRCANPSSGQEYATETLTFSGRDDRQTLRCPIAVTDTGTLHLAISAEEGSASTYTTTASARAAPGDGPTDQGIDSGLAIAGVVVAAIALIGALVAAVVLTRPGEADAERETYEHCPACDGEIEGHEPTCPYCEMDLDEARRSFHDCGACEATIPDIMSHCPYCGDEQDLSAYFDRRERKYTPLPETEEVVEEEPEVDENEVVRGYADIGDLASGLGYDEDQLESEWDENLAEAEGHFESLQVAAAAEAERMAEIAESEEDFVVETHLSQVMDDLPEHDLDAFLGDVEKRRHLKDGEVELSASDAHYREHLFEMTGEEGVLPGQEVNVEMMVDSTVVGNEVRSATSDFTVKDDDPLPAPEPAPAPEPEPEPEPEPAAEDAPADKKPRRRAARRRKE